MKKPDHITAELLATIGAWTLHNAQGKPEIAEAIVKDMLPQFQNRYPHEKLLTHWCDEAKQPARVVPDVEKVQVYTVARRLSARLPNGEVLSVAPDDWRALADDLHAHGAAADAVIFGNDEDDGKARAVSGMSAAFIAERMWRLEGKEWREDMKNEAWASNLDQATEHAVRRFLSLIADRYNIAGAILYGSRARGTHRPDSDADVAILLSGAQQRLMPIILDMADIAFDVLLETEILVSPLPVWLDEWEHPETYSNPALLRNIDQEGIRLKP